MGSLTVALAYILDLLVGDPPRLPHPVVFMGKMILVLERLLYSRHRLAALAGGTLAAVAVVGASYAAAVLLLHLLRAASPLLGTAAEVWLISTTLASRGLAGAARDVLRPLEENNIAEARKRVSGIVGRDTYCMDAGEITRATVETVAENAVDGVIAPLFYALIGGAPLALAYKAVNTLDSMLGYRNERYLYFGRFSARLDDVANYIPARLGGLMLLAAAWITGMRAWPALRAVVRDAGRHPSPNSGIPEAAVAGALGVRLGGLNMYGGRESFREYMGDDLYPLRPAHIRQAVRLMYVSSFLALLAGVAARCALAWAGMQ